MQKITPCIAKSKGSRLFDSNSKSFFLDFISMYSSLPLGYNHSIFQGEFEKEANYISKVKPSINLYDYEEFSSFLLEFKTISINPFIHTVCTGSLAVEAAIKSAFWYKKSSEKEVVCIKKSFHGINSWGFTTDIDHPTNKLRLQFSPRLKWNFVEPEQAIEYIKTNKDHIAAVLIEPIQCTSGDIYLSWNLIKEINKLCIVEDLCFIIDEVQTGFGVTGNYWLSEMLDLKPDILIFGKKTQISGIATNKKFSEAITSTDRVLKATFDGDLIDAVRSKYIIKAIKEHHLLDNIKIISDLLKKKLNDKFLAYRSCGGLIAFDFVSKFKRDLFCDNLRKNKVLVNPTADKTVRVRPNLATTLEEAEEFCNIVVNCV
jgi:L-lysine 6-transaminase